MKANIQKRIQEIEGWMNNRGKKKIEVVYLYPDTSPEEEARLKQEAHKKVGPIGQVIIVKFVENWGDL